MKSEASFQDLNKHAIDQTGARTRLFGDKKQSGPKFTIGDCRESITGIGVVWPVKRLDGRCGCGAVEMGEYVAFFVSREDAESFIRLKESGPTDQQAQDVLVQSQKKGMDQS